MKNVIIIAATAALALSACTKESSLSPTNSINEGVNEVQRSAEEGFVVGRTDLTISYDIVLLEDLFARILNESSASGLNINRDDNSNFSLAGNAGNTDFNVSLTQDSENQLIWSESSVVSACENNGAGCTLIPIDPIDPNLVLGSEPCDWPWMVKSDTDKR